MTIVFTQQKKNHMPTVLIKNLDKDHHHVSAFKRVRFSMIQVNE